MTDSEMQRMQQEAIRRTQEMQRRAAVFNKPPERPANKVPNVHDMPPQNDINEVPKERQPEKPALYHKPPDVREQTMISGGIFETLFRDKEKTLILGILLLLMDEKTDNALIMALMYLLI